MCRVRDAAGVLKTIMRWDREMIEGNRLDAPISDGPNGGGQNTVGRRSRGYKNTAVHRTTGDRHTSRFRLGDTNTAEERFGRSWEAARADAEDRHWPMPDDPSGLSIG